MEFDQRAYPHVYVAIPSATSCPHAECMSAAGALGAGRVELFPGGAIPVQSVRNGAVRQFLAGPWSHLLFIDDDVVVPPDTLELLLQTDADLVAGMVPSVLQDLPICLLNCKPKRGPDNPRGTVWYRRWPVGPVEIEACGMACTLIRREAFAAVSPEPKGNGDKPWQPWFQWLETRDGAIFGEDLTFCWKLRDAGGSLWADGRVRCDHIKGGVGLARFVPNSGAMYQRDITAYDPEGDIPERMRRVYTAV